VCDDGIPHYAFMACHKESFCFFLITHYQSFYYVHNLRSAKGDNEKSHLVCDAVPVGETLPGVSGELAVSILGISAIQEDSELTHRQQLTN
jgi:hypothetical protein